MLRKLSPLVSACALAVAGGCGDDGNDETSAKPSVTTRTQEATAGLERFLLARGEEPGYQPSGPVETLSTAEEYAARGPRTQAIARRLRDEGFVSFLRRELEGRKAQASRAFFCSGARRVPSARPQWGAAISTSTSGGRR
jgi:hypothetical protein